MKIWAACAILQSAVGLLTERVATRRQPFKLAHIIAPVPWRSRTQELVFETLGLAAEKAEQQRPSLSVSLHAVQLEGDPNISIPGNFRLARPLRRSTSSEYNCSRALPFVADVLRALQEAAPDADAYVLSNADIGALPDLYLRIHDASIAGFDGLNVFKMLLFEECNGTKLAENRSYAIDWAERLPQVHKGSDFFVWKASATSQILPLLGRVFFGYGPIGAVMSDAIGRTAERFTVVQGQRWTFHVGGPGELTFRGPAAADMTAYMQWAEAEYPGCRFHAGTEISDGMRQKTDCDYNELNKHYLD